MIARKLCFKFIPFNLTLDYAETKTGENLYYTQIFGLIDKEIEEELITILIEKRYNLLSKIRQLLT